MRKSPFRHVVGWAFALVSLVALALFQQAINAFATQRGWDQFFIDGWKRVTDLGWENAVAFSFFTLGGATLALWIEFWMRDRRAAKTKLSQHTYSCTAHFTFTKSSAGALGVRLNDARSSNVAYWVWYLNNGGTMRNEAVLIFVEFERPVHVPEVFAYSNAPHEEWRQVASTDRFMFVELKGWPDGEIVLQAFALDSLAQDRRSELMIWRKYIRWS